MAKSSFTQGKILAPLIKFSLPILFAYFLQAMYGAVDLLVVGQFGDTTSVSAVATGSQIMQTVTGLITGLTMGATVLIGQKIGEKNDKAAADAVGSSICLFTVIGVIASVIMLLLSKPFATAMNAPQEAFEKTVEYVTVCSGGAIFIVAYNVISGIFRGIGNSKLPLIFVGIACVANIIGDLILVGVFHLDAMGAAIATIAAQAISVIISIIIIKKQGLPFEFSVKDIRFNKASIGKILKLGFPIALQDALTNVSFLIITAVINALGLVASAAVGVSEKLVLFIMLVPISFMSSVSAFVAQNIGAGEQARAKKSMWYAMLSSLVFGVIMFLFVFFRGNLLVGIFAKDIEVIMAAAEYMKAYAIDCIFVCVLFCFMGYFNGCGKTIFVMIQGVAAAFLIRVPYSFFMSRVPGVTMLKIGFASPISTVLSIILCFIYFGYVQKKIKQNEDNKKKLIEVKNEELTE